MKKKLIYTLMTLLLLVSFYEVIFRTKTVTYKGEDSQWSVNIENKLVGLNGSYGIEIRYKGKEQIKFVDFNIHPHFRGGFPVKREEGSYYLECNQDCGYYEKESKLLFFIVWREGEKGEEHMRFIDLIKAPSN
jgi:hypothetical protein